MRRKEVMLRGRRRLRGTRVAWVKDAMDKKWEEGPWSTTDNEMIRTKHNDTYLWKCHDKLYTNLSIVWKQEMKMQNICSVSQPLAGLITCTPGGHCDKRKREIPPGGSNGTNSAARLATFTQYYYNLEIFILILHRGLVEVELIDFHHCNAKNYFFANQLERVSYLYFSLGRI